jgi:biopolymer transport protein TolR
MAFRLQQEDDLGSISNINVTPLVDVMLVLLIIFMMTAPMLVQGIEVQLPGGEGQTFETASEEPTTISIARDGTVYLDEQFVGTEDLETILLTMLRGEQIEGVLVRADTDVAYGHVIRVISILSRAGIEDVGMVTEAWEGEDARRGR